MSRSDAPYFAPIPASITNPKPSIESHRRLWAARDLLEMARKHGGFGAEHSTEDYAFASKLYAEAAEMFDTLGDRASEAETARHLADVCRQKSGRP